MKILGNQASGLACAPPINSIKFLQATRANDIPLGGSIFDLARQSDLGFIQSDKNRPSLNNIPKFDIFQIYVYIQRMSWTVLLKKQVVKNLKKLPKDVQLLAQALTEDLKQSGPVQFTWKNYSKLSGEQYHCHLNYSYVACWEVIDKKIKILEVYYVGSREKAPY